MVDLDTLRADITAAAEKVRDLKSSSTSTADASSSSEALQAALAELLRLKKEFADNNDGMGVDGKPFALPMSKGEKKAKAKAEKAGATGEGPAVDKPVSLICRPAENYVSFVSFRSFSCC
jgi:hypothetical protein